ncbi:MAG: SNF2-related protein [bacterium]
MGFENGLTDYHAKYFAYELTRKHAANNLGKLTSALQDAQVDLNPHQVDAALFAFESPLSKGAILADEVGLGKTIEAGIILSQKWAERYRKLLIIAPANLRKQWNQELLDKFFLPSFIIETKSFNTEQKIGVVNPFERNEIVICSYQFVKAKKDFIKNVNWDLVIIDEAHRLRNVYKPANKTANAIKAAVLHARKVLLTATPLQNSLLELYGLVSIIDDYAFGDLKSYKSKYSKIINDTSFDDLKNRLNPICKRTLRKQVLEYINYTNRIAIVEEFIPYPQEQKLYDLVSEYLRNPDLFALPKSQRQLMTLVLRKLLASSTFAIQNTLRGLTEKLNILLIEQGKFTEEDKLFVDYETFEETKEEWTLENDAEESETVKRLTDDELIEVKAERDLLKDFTMLAESILKNSKGDKLLTALEKGFEKLKELNAPQKAIIFTESTRTQTYIKQILENDGYADKIVLFNGSNTDALSKTIYNQWILKYKGSDKITGSKSADMRQAIVDYFRNTATIMIATEAAAEGINLQFCSLVVNYDLPWNPQRIEQRIGRCHRYGQKFDVVVINFLNKANEADQRVYKLLDEKFKLFSGVFGASDEVLGSIESGVDFEKRIVQIYQECRKSEEIKAAFDKLQNEYEVKIEEGLNTARKTLLEHFDEDVHNKLKINLQKGKEYLNQFEQWLWNLTKFGLDKYAVFNEEDNSFNLEQNPFEDENINTGYYKLLRASNVVKKTQIELPADLNIYRIGHVLAQKIVNKYINLNTKTCKVVFDYSNEPKKISVLNNLVGKKGWLQVSLYTISSFEVEEYILFACFTDDGEIIDPDTTQKFFSVIANEGNIVILPNEINPQFVKLNNKQIEVILDENLTRNHSFFDKEYDKMDKWADDMKLSLEKEIKDLDAEIKLKKAETSRAADLKTKINLRRETKEMEKKRNLKRKHLFVSQDEIDIKKDNLINQIELRLKQKTGIKTLFTINWQIV